VLGWGGYWAWDPVENVALLPWLTATAFLHSAMVQQRRGILGGWNVGLVIASFVLTILATLITRSGILNSVHAFTQSLVGPLFLVLLGATIVGSIVLVGLRLPDSGPAPSRLGARSTGFLLNNLLLSAIAATVLFGTLFPLLAEAVGAGQVSVGAPYFERLVGPLAVGLLVLLGIGPFLPWGVWSPASRRQLIPGAVAALAVASAVVVAGGGSEATAGAAAGTFALVQSARSVVQRIVSIGRRAGGIHTSVLPAGRGRRSAGGLLAHVGIAVMALAVIGSSTGRREVGQAIATGGRFVVGPYELRLDGFQQETRPDRRIISAVLVIRGGQSEITAAPSLSFFPQTSSAIATPAVFTDLGEDLYVTLTDVDLAAGTATVRVGLHPFQVWLWIGGAIVVAGGLIAAWPGARRNVTRPGDPDGQPIYRPVAPRNALHGVVEDGSR
jgi:cytochrome c-type biogenesis protein CcmF